MTAMTARLLGCQYLGHLHPTSTVGLRGPGALCVDFSESMDSDGGEGGAASSPVQPQGTLLNASYNWSALQFRCCLDARQPQDKPKENDEECFCVSEQDTWTTTAPPPAQRPFLTCCRHG